eukprot:gene6352-8586_t
MADRRATPDPQALSDHVKSLALVLGFDVCRVATPAGIGGAGDGLAGFVAAGYHGDMDWLPDTLERRAPRRPSTPRLSLTGWPPSSLARSRSIQRVGSRRPKPLAPPTAMT